MKPDIEYEKGDVVSILEPDFWKGRIGEVIGKSELSHGTDFYDIIIYLDTGQHKTSVYWNNLEYEKSYFREKRLKKLLK